ncbi:hypothetical protein TNCV_1923891 [Trichonephila clavipes]|nr:hypothetical protein TNCV_1923891 [Trichonephila clavipes]
MHQSRSCLPPQKKPSAVFTYHDGMCWAQSEESFRSRTRLKWSPSHQIGGSVANLVDKNDANLAPTQRFHQVTIESP